MTFSRATAVMLGAFGAAVVSAAGCGHRTDLPPRAKVTGLVTLDGRPLGTGMVQFVPDGSKGNKGPVAVGTIDASGKYRLATDRQGDGDDGAVIGFHKVRVEARGKPRSPHDSLPPSLVPTKYSNPDTSGLTVEVKVVELNDIPLVLKSK